MKLLLIYKLFVGLNVTISINVKIVLVTFHYPVTMKISTRMTITTNDNGSCNGNDCPSHCDNVNNYNNNSNNGNNSNVVNANGCRADISNGDDVDDCDEVNDDHDDDDRLRRGKGKGHNDECSNIAGTDFTPQKIWDTPIATVRDSSENLLVLTVIEASVRGKQWRW